MRNSRIRFCWIQTKRTGREWEEEVWKIVFCLHDAEIQTLVNKLWLYSNLTVTCLQRWRTQKPVDKPHFHDKSIFFFFFTEGSQTGHLNMSLRVVWEDIWQEHCVSSHSEDRPAGSWRQVISVPTSFTSWVCLPLDVRHSCWIMCQCGRGRDGATVSWMAATHTSGDGKSTDSLVDSKVSDAFLSPGDEPADQSLWPR